MFSTFMTWFDIVNFIGLIYFLFFPCSFTCAPFKATYWKMTAFKDITEIFFSHEYIVNINPYKNLSDI